MDSEVSSSPPAAIRSWRAATCVRIFAIALVVGEMASRNELTAALPALLAVSLIALVAIVLEWGVVASKSTPWNAAIEGLLVATLTASVLPDVSLFVYLCVPPIVAGIRHGPVTTANTAAIEALAVAATLAATTGASLWHLQEAIVWASAGLGVGLLASWQSRELRETALRQAPALAAHDLVSQLHTLTQRGDIGLDLASVATAMHTAMRERTGADRAAVLLDQGRGRRELVASHGDTGDLIDLPHAPQEALPPEVALVELHSTDRQLGVALVHRAGGWPLELCNVLAEISDDFAVKLDTAGVFDRVRSLSATEERHRIAREMHDGVAQEIVALGYLADEIADLSADPEVRASAEHMRGEITRVVTELRLSIFDLRQNVSGTHLSGALTEYARQISEDTSLQVNLVLDVSGQPLSPRIESELLRVAQEAIGNVRKHANASTIWVSLVTDGSSILLEVEDDGVGNATPRKHHWGLTTMRERAQTIGATLDVLPRLSGGTTVRLTSGTPQPLEGTRHASHSAPGR